MKLTDPPLLKLEQMRRILLVDLDNGKGARVAFRSRSLEFEERDAILLMNQFEVRIYDRILSVYDEVQIDWPRVSKWATMNESLELEELVAARAIPIGSHNMFRILAFVSVPGKIKGGMRCEGIFCVLSKLDQGDSVHEDAGFICRGQEIGRERGKVMLYPVECLVPATMTEACYNAIGRSMMNMA